MKTPYYSYKIGTLAKGCRLCVKGSKLVMFITGLCPRCCYFCPISDKKYKKDVVYADEWPTKNINEIIKEAKSIDAEGAGFTGGDPLCKLTRTINYIKNLKKEFGKKFHIHLYTSLNLVTERNMQQLYEAGLDEIRIHLDIDNPELRPKIALVLSYGWDVGVEIPVIPKKEKQLKNIILFINSVNHNSQNKIKFLNLNELEVADNKVNQLTKLGYKTKNNLSYAIKGSEELAFRLLKFIEKNKIKLNVHYCTATLKDKVQLANRIKRRAKNVKKPYDLVTDEGLLFRGAIYSTKNLVKIKNSIIKNYKIKDDLLEIDKKRSRILIEPEFLYKNKEKLKKQNLKLALVEEYPTWDCLNITTEFL